MHFHGFFHARFHWRDSLWRIDRYLGCRGRSIAINRRKIMGAIIAILYGSVVYAVFLGTFLYAVGFVSNQVVPKTIDSGPVGPLLPTLIINLCLLAVFAVQHSVMARPGFKRWWTRVVPKSVERSTYVLFASAALLLLYWQWQPLPTALWTVTDRGAAQLLNAVFWFGWALVLISTFVINHFELFGLRQVFARLMRRELPEPTFKTPSVYRYVRHPIYLGFLLAFWATPSMTVGHFLFAVGTTGYILIGIWFEERDLINQFGDRYRRYREQVGMLLPRPTQKNLEEKTKAATKN
jgi:protein-S-isoprenylcysteine O-methyltransferase Ste14